MKKEIAKLLSSVLSIDEEEIFFSLEEPPTRDKGDLSLPCFKFSKTLRKSPVQIANDIISQVSQKVFDEIGVDTLQNINGYLNFFFNRDAFTSLLLQKSVDASIEKTNDPKTVAIEYSSPNIAKHFKIYHIRSTIIGQSLANMYESLGHKTIKINHLGDWGTQFGSLMAAYKMWGNKQLVEKDPINELTKLYVLFHQKAKTDPTLADQGRLWFKKLEDGDKEAVELWEWFKEESLKEFDKMYEKLGVSFDYTLGESFYSDKMDEVIESLTQSNLLVEDQGALVVKLDELGIIPCIIQKSDGTSIYATRDLAASMYREKAFHPDKMLYVVDKRQSLHFQQFFAVLDKLHHPMGSKSKLIPFGVMEVNGVVGSTRQGQGLLLSDALDLATEKAKEMIATNQNSHVPSDKIDETAEQIALSAIIMTDLKQQPSLDINFIPDEALKFEGKTGPYLQYTYARIQTLLEKRKLSDSDSFDASFLNTKKDEVWNIIYHLNTYNSVLKDAVDKENPSKVSSFLFELAQLFNHYYAKEKIITDNVEETKAKLLFSKKIGEYLKHGLTLLCIQTPNKL